MTETTVSSSEEQQPRPAYARLALTIVLAPYAIPLLRHPESGSFLDGIDLAIHATGHLVFGPFGEVIAAAGGTLFQLIACRARAHHQGIGRGVHAIGVVVCLVAVASGIRFAITRDQQSTQRTA